jgi:UDP-N-acetylglucosamine/UDP-N-acetylgalactosamine diphosphorylase
VKQTVFMPWVTAGSLINFCDALVAGGTNRKDHSEIGSSYVHFNFTPQRDKATASLIGDVPHGVLLNTAAIFLGGQGGIVGPCKIEYGTVIPAGHIWRWNSAIHRVEPSQVVTTRFNSTTPKILRIARINLTYIGNILALDAWYRVIRAPFMSDDPSQRACHQGALQRISEILAERFSRLDEFMQNLRAQPFAEQWASTKDTLAQTIAGRATAPVPRDVIAIVKRLPKVHYLQTIQSIPDSDAQRLTRWLTGISNACWEK